MIRGTSIRARARGAIGIVLVLSVGASPELVRASGESGGSGLFRVEQAYSMPIGRPLISFYGGYFSSDSTPGGSHLFTLIPSVTWGLGGGFEGAVALPLEGITTDLDSLAYDRRIDLRKRDLVAKIRWTTPLGASSSRLGIETMLGLPFGDSTRPGGDRSPSLNLDPGLVAMYSTNFGGLRYPLRLHANAGYWWSRDDGAFYFRDFPDAVPITANGASSNDVFTAAIGVEVGFRRFVGLAEVETQQFTQARSQLDSSENLWLLTVGLRAALTSTIGMTAGLAFDLSSDDPSTSFDPGDFYPGVEFRLGLTFGGVLSREKQEARRSEERDRERLEDNATTSRAEETATTAFDGTAPDRTPRSRSTGTDAATIRQLEARIAQLEIDTRLSLLETRLRMLENSGAPRPGTPPGDLPLRAQIEALQRQLLLLQEAALQSEASPEPAIDPTPDPTPNPTPTPTSEPRSTPAPGSSSSTPDRTGENLSQESPTTARDVPGLAYSPPRSVQVSVDRSAPPPAPIVAIPPVAAAETPREHRSDPALSSNPRNPVVSEVEAAVEPVAAAHEEPAAEFRLGIGERALVEDIEFASGAALQSPRSRETLETLAAELQARDDVRVVLIVHGGGTDREGALQWTAQQAEMFRNYLVAAGAHPEQVVALGLGNAESPTDSASRVEIERIR